MEPEREDGALRRQVLGLAEIQMEGASGLLDFYIDRFEPWPEFDEAPLTELQLLSARVHRCYLAIADRVEDLEARARESRRSGPGLGEETGEES